MVGAVISLDDLGVKYGTDKSSECHGYTRWYEENLDRFVSNTCTLLEIGIGNGASLRMWRDWLNPNSSIMAIDLDKSACAMAEAEDFIVFNGDQEDRDFMSGLVVTPDIVVDDGCHTAAAQIASFECLWPKLRSGGIYIIEDLQTSYWWGGNLMDYLKNLIDKVHNNGIAYQGQISNSEKVDGLDAVARELIAIKFYPSTVLLFKEPKL
jgi:Methyltransferase domain